MTAKLMVLFFPLAATIACATACNPCDRKAFARTCGLSNGVAVECAAAADCIEGERCLACGVCVAEDECGTLAASCASNADCSGGFVCNERCGCVGP